MANKVIVVIPKELDTKIQIYCKGYGLSRSEFVRNAIIEKLEKIDSRFHRTTEPLNY